MRTPDVVAFINEREAIRLRKEVLKNQYYAGSDSQGASRRVLYLWWKKGQWTLDHLTEDPILQKFRFCNVRREDDRVTTWIRQNIIERWPDHQYLWLMLAIARTINWPPTLECLINCADIGAWPSDPSFSPALLGETMQEYKNLGNKLYTGAYMIRAPSSPSELYFTWSKQRYIAEIVIGRLWETRDRIEGVIDYDGRSSQETWEYLQRPEFVGWGPFMAYQLVVDLQHTRYLRDAPDVQTWAAAGPGTLRGLNRWQEAATDAPLKQADALDLLLELRQTLDAPGALAPWVGQLDLSDVCNVMCEFDKYERVRLGQGRPRALYVSGREY